MIKPIEILKDPDRAEHLPYDYPKEVFQNVIDGVDLEDLTEFIKELNDASWVPKCYWKNKGKDINHEMWYGELSWAMYSYLVDRKLLIVEDQYYRYNKSRTEKYKDRHCYFNPLEKQLYHPIVKRLLDEKWLDIARVVDYTYSKGYYYKLGVSHQREEKLNEILN